jgi:hypothetical protein
MKSFTEWSTGVIQENYDNSNRWVAKIFDDVYGNGSAEEYISKLTFTASNIDGAVRGAFEKLGVSLSPEILRSLKTGNGACFISPSTPGMGKKGDFFHPHMPRSPRISKAMVIDERNIKLFSKVPRNISEYIVYAEMQTGVLDQLLRSGSNTPLIAGENGWMPVPSLRNQSDNRFLFSMFRLYFHTIYYIEEDPKDFTSYKVKTELWGVDVSRRPS